MGEKFTNEKGQNEATLSTYERHVLAACWNDEQGNHQPAKWGDVLAAVERIISARQHTEDGDRD